MPTGEQWCSLSTKTPGQRRYHHLVPPVTWGFLHQHNKKRETNEQTTKPNRDWYLAHKFSSVLLWNLLHSAHTVLVVTGHICQYPVGLENIKKQAYVWWALISLPQGPRRNFKCSISPTHLSMGLFFSVVLHRIKCWWNTILEIPT